jgi:hypothetical protein
MRKDRHYFRFPIFPNPSLQGGSMLVARLLAFVLVVCGFVAAADSLSAAAPAAPPVQNPAPDSTAAKAPAATLPVSPAIEPSPIAPAVIKTPTPPPSLDITWYGVAMFRFREEIITNFKKTDTVKASAALTPRLGYNFGGKFKPNSDLLLEFAIGNDYFSTEEVPGIPGNYLGKRNSLTPWFNLAYAQWDPGYLHIAAGIIPVKGTALLDLLGVSILYDRSYKYASHLSWGIITNCSQTGLRIGTPILKDEFKLGVDLTAAVIQNRVAQLGIDTMNVNYPAWELLLEFPMAERNITLTPQVFAIPFRSFNKVTQMGDFEYGAGVDIGYKVNDAIKLRAGFGIAQNSNFNSNGPNDTVYTNPFNPNADSTKRERTPFIRLGTNSKIGTTIKLGPGKIDFDVALSSEYDGKDSTVNDLYPFVDLKYGWSVNKNFIIMPRIRLFYIFPKTVWDYKLTTRPELIFTGSF